MQWKSVNIFISSTFNDMHAERDYLVKDVFPELREWCEERKIHLVDVDLRWGVTEADSSSNHTVLACLNNIDESRPFFLCFLGQRRGWVPGKGEVSAETLEEYPEISHVIGRNSVTEMEIEHALLSPMKHIVNGSEKQEKPVEHALFYFRSPDYLDDLTTEQRKIFTNEAEDDINLADTELKNFKGKIRNRWNYTIDYNCNWDKTILSPELPENVKQGRLTDFSAAGNPLKNIIIAQLKEEIIKEFPDREEVEYSSPLERDLDQQALFIELNSEGFISRAGDFDDLNDYVTNNRDGLFVLSAAAGYGKSMLLANFIKRESRKHGARFFNRFCGVSDLCSQQYSLWRTIFDEAGIACPDTLKDLKDKIEDLLGELAKEKTVLIIDAINQLPDGLDMLEWLPKRLPKNLKIIVSIKEDEELTGAIEKLKENENTSHAAVKPFQEKEEKKKLINDYLKKYLKALDDKQIDTICSFEGSKNPLYLKILLSELRIFGSFAQLSDEIKKFGDTPKEAFNTVLNRLENDINSLNIDSQEFTSLLFGLLANARNGLSEEELIPCLQRELGGDKEKLLQAARLFIRQVRPFMARREGRTDFFYEAFKLSAKERYANDKIKHNTLLADYFTEKADPENNLSFTGKNIRDFNELPYHLKEAENINCLEKIISTYLWIKNKSELSDIFNTIRDYEYIDAENEDNYHVKLIRDTLVMSSHVLIRGNIKDDFPSQLWGRLKDIENQKIKELLIEVERHTDYPWLKPRHYMIAPGGALKVTLAGHTGGVNSVCFSPDGRFVVSGSDNTVRVWDWKKMTEICKLNGHANYAFGVPVNSVRFSPDGKYIVSGAGDKTVRVWDWKSGEEIQKLEGHTNEYTDYVNSVCFSPDGKYIASGSSDDTVRVWDWKSGEETRKLEGNEGCFSPDGRFIASVAGRYISVWDWEKGEAIQWLYGHIESVSSVCFSPDGKFIASGSVDRTVRVWDWENGQEIQKLEGHAGQVKSVCFSPDGRFIASGAGDKTIRVWDWESGEEIEKLEGHAGWVNSVCFSPDGRFIASGSFDNTVRVWDLKKIQGEGHTGNERYITPGDANSVCFSPGGRFVAYGSGDNTVRVLDRESGEEIGRLEGHTDSVHSVHFSHNGKYIVSGAGDDTVRVWDWEKQEEITKLEGHRYRINSVCFSPDGKYIVSGSNDKTIRVWDWENGQEIQKLERKGIESVCFSPDGRFIASGLGDKTVRVWDWKSGEEIRKLEGYVVCFSPDGKYIASGSYDDTVRVWDWKSGEEIRKLEGYAKGISSVCFSRDGKYIASGSWNRIVCVWDWKSGEEIQKLEGHTDSVSSVHFSRDGKYIASGSSDKTVRVWDWENSKKIHRAGHTDSVSSVHFSHNGKYIVSGAGDDTVRVWDWEKQKEIRKLEGHTDSLNSVRFSPDGKYIASGSSDKTVRIWDWENRKEVQKLGKHSGYSTDVVCFSPDGNFIVSGEEGDTICISDWKSGEGVRKLKGYVWCFSPDGKYIVSGSRDDNIVRVWDWKSGEEIRKLEGHTLDSVNLRCVCFSPDGKYVVSSSGKTVRIWDWKSGEEIRIWDLGNQVKKYEKLLGEAVEDICFSSDGKYIIGSFDGTVRVWDWENQKAIVSLDTEEDIRSCAFSNNIRQIVAGGPSGQILMYDVVNLPVGTAIATALRNLDNNLSIRCNYCGGVFDIFEDKLGKIVNCHYCNEELQINDFTADHIAINESHGFESNNLSESPSVNQFADEKINETENLPVIVATRSEVDDVFIVKCSYCSKSFAILGYMLGFIVRCDCGKELQIDSFPADPITINKSHGFENINDNNRNSIKKDAPIKEEKKKEGFFKRLFKGFSSDD